MSKKNCGCLFLPCPVSRQKHHSYVDCAAEPDRLSPGVFEPFGLLLARVDLQGRKYKPLNIQFCFSLSVCQIIFHIVQQFVLWCKHHIMSAVDTIWFLHWVKFSIFNKIYMFLLWPHHSIKWNYIRLNIYISAHQNSAWFIWNVCKQCLARGCCF